MEFPVARGGVVECPGLHVQPDLLETVFTQIYLAVVDHRQEQQPKGKNGEKVGEMLKGG